VLILAICVLVTRPFVEMGVNDDWSYVRTAEVLAQTGHIAYNGWATAMLGWQLLLGALFAKVFGFSFTIVRLPIFFIALITTYLLHRVLARFGLGAWNAALLTLTVVLSPTFMPLVFTFMSDVAGFFCLVLCLYLCQRALQASRPSAAFGWLYCAAITNIVGGSVRQIAWLGVLVMVPCTAWLLRKQKGMLLHGAVLWIAGLASAFLMMHWFAQQPYSVGDTLIEGRPSVQMLAHLLRMVLKALLSLMLFSLPLLVVFPMRLLDLGRGRAARAFLFLAFAMLVLLFAGYVEYKHRHSLDALVLPWLVNLFTVHGIMQFQEIEGVQPTILAPALRAFFSLLTVFCGVSAVLYVWMTRRNVRLQEAAEVSGSLSWFQTALLLVPFSLAYLALLMPRAASISHTLFDRYTTPMMLVLGVFALRYLQEHAKQQGYLLSVVMLTLLTGYTVAGTHDVYALDRARVIAADEITSAGVPRTAVNGGFEYDGWTQILASGYVNDSNIKNPAGAYHPVAMSSDPCIYFFEIWTPAIKPQYVLSFDPVSCYQPSSFAAVPYQTWLPPYDQKVYVQQVH
jgi:hypothetical protein